jgi:hypothetical protein
MSMLLQPPQIINLPNFADRNPSVLEEPIIKDVHYFEAYGSAMEYQIRFKEILRKYLKMKYSMKINQNKVMTSMSQSMHSS